MPPTHYPGKLQCLQPTRYLRLIVTSNNSTVLKYRTYDMSVVCNVTTSACYSQLITLEQSRVVNMVKDIMSDGRYFWLFLLCILQPKTYMYKSNTCSPGYDRGPPKLEYCMIHTVMICNSSCLIYTPGLNCSEWIINAGPWTNTRCWVWGVLAIAQKINLN